MPADITISTHTQCQLHPCLHKHCLQLPEHTSLMPENIHMLLDCTPL